MVRTVPCSNRKVRDKFNTLNTYALDVKSITNEFDTNAKHGEKNQKKTGKRQENQIES